LENVFFVSQLHVDDFDQKSEKETVYDFFWSKAKSRLAKLRENDDFSKRDRQVRLKGQSPESTISLEWRGPGWTQDF
jgi:hypothetical protein